MKKKLWTGGVVFILLLLVLAACGTQGAQPDNTANVETGKQSDNAEPNNGANNEGSSEGNAEGAETETRTITYLDQKYTVPAKAEKIVITGSVESMEDALVLDVKPIGAMTTGGQFAPMFAPITQDTVGIGEKTQPNIEEILKLKPDVILASTKFPAETLEKLNKVTTTIPVSHISTYWQDNLKLLAELAGKQEQAEQVLQKYAEDSRAFKEQIGPVFKDKKVVILRVRAGSLAIYPEDVFFNPSVYADLGASVPEEIKQAKAQQTISLEQLSAMNPDYLFVQFAESENTDTPKALEDFQNNPIWKSLNAVKNDNLFVNLVDPICQGGSTYSRITFLEAVKNSKLILEK
ncbi:ABC transporter substrate-binding protein [Paenibacillus sp. J2TS4]|uniref:ABC transporter substrate-binding protein n=1 Tax=Paenibacillus sp. J2TS4 TaxID=2807194 RepID=UPI001B223B35|nr:ABC transporter substrate-binding protein [Paenibacillus sp. J2TS4]GIP31999.1 iron-uptake system-binding protein [Paenibacillus sp. J2TS4]